MLDALVASEGEPDLVQISGGEPTLHPDFFAILDAVRARPIRHVMINTNGLRIAREPEFVARLAVMPRRPPSRTFISGNSANANAVDLSRCLSETLMI